MYQLEEGKYVDNPFHGTSGISIKKPGPSGDALHEVKRGQDVDMNRLPMAWDPTDANVRRLFVCPCEAQCSTGTTERKFASWDRKYVIEHLALKHLIEALPGTG
ncbi:hypothetical protein GLAREA_04075 [Glarea lozoyensis ATCC 20868]|uniref:Uncharacterized protein n=1 Tax=Glarea lozoyensis (strain ATCC 20868 / MF5171) TaxID=1116229 RepID=S3DXL4_GLAL2|nr:uncharacterized protein GLAREA_04075 [Glarea lozoyensis ATCC 20868]EPE31108.1 hypothetical protein GLAREA_04075 [Glarea lozoyensis ATCC 20868]